MLPCPASPAALHQSGSRRSPYSGVSRSATHKTPWRPTTMSDTDSPIEKLTRTMPWHRGAKSSRKFVLEDSDEDTLALKDATSKCTQFTGTIQAFLTQPVCMENLIGKPQQQMAPALDVQRMLGTPASPDALQSGPLLKQGTVCSPAGIALAIQTIPSPAQPHAAPVTLLPPRLQDQPVDSSPVFVSPASSFSDHYMNPCSPAPSDTDARDHDYVLTLSHLMQNRLHIARHAPVSQPHGNASSTSAHPAAAASLEMPAHMQTPPCATSTASSRCSTAGASTCTDSASPTGGLVYTRTTCKPATTARRLLVLSDEESAHSHHLASAAASPTALQLTTQSLLQPLPPPVQMPGTEMLIDGTVMAEPALTEPRQLVPVGTPPSPASPPIRHVPGTARRLVAANSSGSSTSRYSRSSSSPASSGQVANSTTTLASPQGVQWAPAGIAGNRPQVMHNQGTYVAPADDDSLHVRGSCARQSFGSVPSPQSPSLSPSRIKLPLTTPHRRLVIMPASSTEASPAAPPQPTTATTPAAALHTDAAGAPTPGPAPWSCFKPVVRDYKRRVRTGFPVHKPTGAARKPTAQNRSHRTAVHVSELQTPSSELSSSQVDSDEESEWSGPGSGVDTANTSDRSAPASPAGRPSWADARKAAWTGGGAHQQYRHLSISDINQVDNGMSSHESTSVEASPAKAICVGRGKGKDSAHGQSVEELMGQLNTLDIKGGKALHPQTKAAPPPVPHLPSALSTANLVAAPKRPARLTAQEKQFLTERQAIAQNLYARWNLLVFNQQLPHDLPLVWNPRLVSTAGQVIDDGSHDQVKSSRQQKIPCRLELSPKILTTLNRLRTTLAHEMCHVAAWSLDEEYHAPHGPAFWRWADIFMEQDKQAWLTEKQQQQQQQQQQGVQGVQGLDMAGATGLLSARSGRASAASVAAALSGVAVAAGRPKQARADLRMTGAGSVVDTDVDVEDGAGPIVITRLHNFETHMPFRWQCSNTSCNKVYQRHRNSIDTTCHVCSRCRHVLVFLGKFNKNNKLVATQGRAAAAASTNAAGAAGTPARPAAAPNAYREYVKTQYASLKAAHPPGTPMTTIMKALTAQWTLHKQQARLSEQATTPIQARPIRLDMDQAAGPEEATPVCTPAPRSTSKMAPGCEERLTTTQAVDGAGQRPEARSVMRVPVLLPTPLRGQSGALKLT